MTLRLARVTGRWRIGPIRGLAYAVAVGRAEDGMSSWALRIETLIDPVGSRRRSDGICRKTYAHSNGRGFGLRRFAWQGVNR
jgi:hypothetical protein